MRQTKPKRHHDAYPGKWLAQRFVSLDHLRSSDQEQLRKFIVLCHHWEMLAKEELKRRGQDKK